MRPLGGRSSWERVIGLEGRASGWRHESAVGGRPESSGTLQVEGGSGHDEMQESVGGSGVSLHSKVTKLPRLDRQQDSSTDSAPLPPHPQLRHWQEASSGAAPVNPVLGEAPTRQASPGFPCAGFDGRWV